MYRYYMPDVLIDIDAVVNDLIDGDLELTNYQKSELLQLARDLIAELEG